MDLARAITENHILVSRAGNPVSATTHYHHRRTLERLGLLTKSDGFLIVNEESEKGKILNAASNLGDELKPIEKEAFADVVLANRDCRRLFFDRFVETGIVYSDANTFVANANPVGLRIVRDSENVGVEFLTSEPIAKLAAKPNPGPLPTSGLSNRTHVFRGHEAVQAIHFGLRDWCVHQLNFLDELFRHDAVYTIYPRHITSPTNSVELQRRLTEWLAFDADWTIISVAETALGVGVADKLPLAQLTAILNDWMIEFPDIVAAITTNERFITAGLSPGQRSALLKGFLTDPGGAFVSHLRIHCSILEKLHPNGAPS